MNFRQFATSEFGTRLWLWLGRTVPQRTGYAAARGIAAILARRRNSSMREAVRINQAVVRGGAICGAELDRAVQAVFRHAGFVAFDVARLVAKGDEAIRRAVTIDREAWQHLRRSPRRRARGHALRAACQRVSTGDHGLCAT